MATQETILELALGHVASPGGSAVALMIGKHRSRAVGGGGLSPHFGVPGDGFAPSVLSRRSRWRGLRGPSNASVLVAAVGMTLVILARQIDISIGSQASLCAVVGGIAGSNRVADAAGSACGDAARRCRAWVPSTAWLVAGLGLPSIVVTLATLVILARVAPLPARGGIRPEPTRLTSSGSALGQAMGQWLVVGIAVVCVPRVRLVE